MLDVGLPDIDGFEVPARLRARRSSTSVLVLTARDAVEDRVRGLDLGADDYLTKPFSRHGIRGAGASAAAPESRRRRTQLVVWLALTVDLRGKRVRVDDKPVDLTPREWALLELFLTRPGRVLSKDQIAEQPLTLTRQLSPNAIEVHVSRLRTKIEPAGAHPHAYGDSDTSGTARMSEDAAPAPSIRRRLLVFLSGIVAP